MRNYLKIKTFKLKILLFFFCSIGFKILNQETQFSLMSEEIKLKYYMNPITILKQITRKLISLLMRFYHKSNESLKEQKRITSTIISISVSNLINLRIIFISAVK